MGTPGVGEPEGGGTMMSGRGIAVSRCSRFPHCQQKFASAGLDIRQWVHKMVGVFVSRRSCLLQLRQNLA